MHPSVNESTKVRWTQQVIQYQLLDATEVEELLTEAARQQQDLSTALELRFSSAPERLGKLLQLLDYLTRESLADEQQTAAEGAALTLAARRGKRMTSIMDDAPADGESAGTLEQTDGGDAVDTSNHAATDTPSLRRDEVLPSAEHGASTLRQRLASLCSGPARYVTTEEVGRGGCGVVAKARDLQLDREVVVKRIVDRYATHDEVIERFLNEARITGQLEHPGIVPVYEFGVDEAGNPYYAMKQVRGVTLATRIKELHETEDKAEAKQLLNQLLQRFLDVCQTMAFAHQAGVIHRDLKPANIMIGEFGETILLDWGLARRLRTATHDTESNIDGQTLVAGRSNNKRRSRSGCELPAEDSRESDMTRQGTVLGTAAYMAPEQALGANDRVNEQSDVFALGVILYEILAGSSPFRSDSLETTMQRVVHCEYRRLGKMHRRLPPPLIAICEHAMQREQKTRYRHAGEFAKDLQSYLSGGMVGVYRESAWERFDRTAENHRGIFRTAFLACLLITGVSVAAVGRITQSHRAERVARTMAVEAHGEALAALDAERIARERALQQLASSREAADTWLVGLSGDLQYYPGLDGLRKSLITQAREHYDGVLRVAEQQLAELKGSPESSTPDSTDDLNRAVGEVAACRLRLGDLLRLNGELDAANAQFQQVQEIVRNSAKAESTLTPLLRLQIANAIVGQALLESERHASDAVPLATQAKQDARIGTAESTGEIHQAIEIANELLQSDPSLLDARNLLARALVIAARIAAQQGEHEQAKERLDEAFASVELLAQQTHAVKVQKLKRTVLEDRARLLYQASEFESAIEACQQLIYFLDQLHRLYPNRPDLLEGRSLAHSLLGAAQIAVAQPSQAIQAYDTSGQDLNDAWDLLYGQEFYRENMAVISANNAMAMEMLGEHEQAEVAWRQAISELRGLLDTDGVSASRVADMCNAYLSLARLLFDHKQADVEIAELIDRSNVLVTHLESEDNPVAEEFRIRQGLLTLENDVRLLQLEAAENKLLSLEQQLPQSQRLSAASRALLTVRLHFARLRFEQARHPNQAFDLHHELRQLDLHNIHQYPLAEHAVYAGLLELLALKETEQGSSFHASQPQQLAQEWTRAFDQSPEAWRWLATWSYLAEDQKGAEDAYRRAVKLQVGTENVEHQLLEAILVREVSNIASPIRAAAVARAQESPYTTPQRQLLLKMLEMK